MFLAILNKEFIKLRSFWLAAFVFNMCIVAYIALGMAKLFRLDHAEVVWYRVIHLGQIFYEPFMYVMVVTGIFMAAAQFFPEMKSHRFRISLHLPLAPHLIVLGHVLVGLVAVLLILGTDLLALALMTNAYFPQEIVWRSVITALPWALAGLCAYVGTTLVILEPTWRLQVVNFIVAAGVTGLFLRQGDPGAYAHILWALSLLVLWFAPSVLLPAYRFRYRRF